MNRLDIDIVILSLDRVELTLETIQNVIDQRDAVPLVWVIDQGSSTRTLEMLEAESAEGRIHLVKLGRNIGVSAGRDRGFRMGRAEIIVSLDNDAVLESKDALSQVAAHFEQDPALGAMSFRLLNYYSRLDDATSWAFPRSLQVKKAVPFLATRFLGGACAVRRKAFDETRGFDESLFFYWEELDLSHQLIQAGYRIRYQPSIVALHKVSPDARITWADGRFYYLVRNALYVDYKYFASPSRFLVRAGGYLVKGIYNRLGLQAARAIRDAVSMSRALSAAQRMPLHAEARRYIRDHELRYRGGFLRRVASEVFERLP